jgi:cytidine deaminase
MMKSVSAPSELLEAARRATRFAYAPYSKFHVGAAVLATDGRIFSAANVENASYGLTICAERAAVFKAVSEGATQLVAAAVSVDPSTSPEPFPPCGACRQVLAEFMPPEANVTIDKLGTFSMRDLLPITFESRIAKRHIR